MGMVHIYCGDGKGKSTAALGAALRAAGRGFSVLVARFLKTDHSGEIAALAQVKGITLWPCSKNFGFSWNMSEEQKKEAADFYTQQLTQVWESAVRKPQENENRLLILDEAVGACNLGFIEEAYLISLLQKKPSFLEVILTGRNPSEILLSLADYVTEMRKIKHPYDAGAAAREGIEY